MKLPLLLVALVLLGLSSSPAQEYWLDMLTGEEVTPTELGNDLATVQVVYAGEIHRLDRHHATQLALLEMLQKQGGPLAIGLEQIEARYQPEVDRFNAKELDFDGLAKAIAWDKQWSNYRQYQPLLEFAQQHGIEVRALNAPAEIVRQVGRKGLASLSPEQRQQLAADINTDDPVYEKLMNLLLAVHMAMDPEKLRPVFEAQVARDETMAENIAVAMKGADGQARRVLVICGRGHISYGLGIPQRVARRLPESKARIMLPTESGQLTLTPEEEAMKRDITIPHETLREMRRPLADYLHVLPRSQAGEK